MTKAPRRKAARRRTAASVRSRPPAQIPERGLKIGEAAETLGVETYVLRFWETQFPFLKPKHSKTKHRFYHQRDLDVLRLIKRLLHDEGFTIAGANKHIRENGLDALLAGKPVRSTRAAEPAAPAPRDTNARGASTGVIAEVRRDLESLRRLLRE